MRDSRSAAQLSRRLEKLHERRALHEESIRLHQPSLRNAETLFAEFDSSAFEIAGFEPDDKLVVATDPTWQESTEQARATLLLRIATAATKAVNQSMGVTLPVSARHQRR